MNLETIGIGIAGVGLGLFLIWLAWSVFAYVLGAIVRIIRANW